MQEPRQVMTTANTKPSCGPWCNSFRTEQRTGSRFVDGFLSFGGWFCNCRCGFNFLGRLVSRKSGAPSSGHFENRADQSENRLKTAEFWGLGEFVSRPSWFQVLFSSEFPQFMQLGLFSCNLKQIAVVTSDRHLVSDAPLPAMARSQRPMETPMMPPSLMHLPVPPPPKTTPPPMATPVPMAIGVRWTQRVRDSFWSRWLWLHSVQFSFHLPLALKIDAVRPGVLAAPVAPVAWPKVSNSTRFAMAWDVSVWKWKAWKAWHPGRSISTTGARNHQATGGDFFGDSSYHSSGPVCQMGFRKWSKVLVVSVGLKCHGHQAFCSWRRPGPIGSPFTMEFWELTWAQHLEAQFTPELNCNTIVNCNTLNFEPFWTQNSPKILQKLLSNKYFRGVQLVLSWCSRFFTAGWCWPQQMVSVGTQLAENLGQCRWGTALQRGFEFFRQCHRGTTLLRLDSWLQLIVGSCCIDCCVICYRLVFWLIFLMQTSWTTPWVIRQCCVLCLWELAQRACTSHGGWGFRGRRSLGLQAAFGLMVRFTTGLVYCWRHVAPFRSFCIIVFACHVSFLVVFGASVHEYIRCLCQGKPAVPGTQMEKTCTWCDGKATPSPPGSPMRTLVRSWLIWSRELGTESKVDERGRGKMVKRNKRRRKRRTRKSEDEDPVMERRKAKIVPIRNVRSCPCPCQVWCLEWCHPCHFWMAKAKGWCLRWCLGKVCLHPVLAKECHLYLLFILYLHPGLTQQRAFLAKVLSVKICETEWNTSVFSLFRSFKRLVSKSLTVGFKMSSGCVSLCLFRSGFPMKGFGKGFPRPLGKDAAEMQRFASDKKQRLRDFLGNLHDSVGKDLLRFSTEKLAKAKELVEAPKRNGGDVWLCKTQTLSLCWRMPSHPKICFFCGESFIIKIFRNVCFNRCSAWSWTKMPCPSSHPWNCSWPTAFVWCGSWTLRPRMRTTSCWWNCVGSPSRVKLVHVISWQIACKRCGPTEPHDLDGRPQPCFPVRWNLANPHHWRCHHFQMQGQSTGGNSLSNSTRITIQTRLETSMVWWPNTKVEREHFTCAFVKSTGCHPTWRKVPKVPTQRIRRWRSTVTSSLRSTRSTTLRNCPTLKASFKSTRVGRSWSTRAFVRSTVLSPRPRRRKKPNPVLRSTNSSSLRSMRSTTRRSWESLMICLGSTRAKRRPCTWRCATSITSSPSSPRLRRKTRRKMTRKRMERMERMTRKTKRTKKRIPKVKLKRTRMSQARLASWRSVCHPCWNRWWRLQLFMQAWIKRKVSVWPLGRRVVLEKFQPLWVIVSNCRVWAVPKPRSWPSAWGERIKIDGPSWRHSVKELSSKDCSWGMNMNALCSGYTFCHRCCLECLVTFSSRFLVKFLSHGLRAMFLQKCSCFSLCCLMFRTSWRCRRRLFDRCCRWSGWGTEEVRQSGGSFDRCPWSWGARVHGWDGFRQWRRSRPLVFAMELWGEWLHPADWGWEAGEKGSGRRVSKGMLDPQEIHSNAFSLSTSQSLWSRCSKTSRFLAWIGWQVVAWHSDSELGNRCSIGDRGHHSNHWRPWCFATFAWYATGLPDRFAKCCSDRHCSQCRRTGTNESKAGTLVEPSFSWTPGQCRLCNAFAFDASVATKESHLVSWNGPGCTWRGGPKRCRLLGFRCSRWRLWSWCRHFVGCGSHRCLSTFATDQDEDQRSFPSGNALFELWFNRAPAPGLPLSQESLLELSWQSFHGWLHFEMPIHHGTLRVAHAGFSQKGLQTGHRLEEVQEFPRATQCLGVAGAVDDQVGRLCGYRFGQAQQGGSGFGEATQWAHHTFPCGDSRCCFLHLRYEGTQQATHRVAGSTTTINTGSQTLCGSKVAQRSTSTHAREQISLAREDLFGQHFVQRFVRFQCFESSDWKRWNASPTHGEWKWCTSLLPWLGSQWQRYGVDRSHGLSFTHLSERWGATAREIGEENHQGDCGGIGFWTGRKGWCRAGLG